VPWRSHSGPAVKSRAAATRRPASAAGDRAATRQKSRARFAAAEKISVGGIGDPGGQRTVSGRRPGGRGHGWLQLRAGLRAGNAAHRFASGAVAEA